MGGEILKDKKILIIFSLITLALIFSLTLIDKDKEDLTKGIDKGIKEISKGVEGISGDNNVKADEESHNSNKDKNEDNSSKKDNIIIEKQGESIYLKGQSKEINPITSLNWFDSNIIRFNYTYQGDGGIQNNIYDYNISQDKLNLKFNIEGILWEWKRAHKNGIIYSNDGFNGLYYIDSNENNKRITERQEWYNVSPDGKKVIISGIPTESEKKEINQFIYHMDKGKLQEVNYIPRIDYVFSYIAATWSPDSTHIVSQIPKINNQINIIDINEGIEKEIKMEKDILTKPMWSNDGKKLAFLIQSEEYKEYIFDDLEMSYYLSNKIGIYNTETKKTKIIDFKNNLTTSPIYWSEDSNGIIIETARKKDIESLFKNSSDKIYGDVEYIDTNSGNKRRILEDTLDLSEGYPVHKVTPIELFENNIFIFRDNDKNIKSINIMDLEKEKIINEEIGYLYDYSRKDNDIYLISNEGVYTIDNKLNINNMIDFKSYFGESILNVEVKISPNYEKILFYVQYDQQPSNSPFIEIKDLN